MLADHPDKVARFIKTQDFDIINFQEVTGGILSKSVPDSFGYFKKVLNLNGELVKSWSATDDGKSYFGNATFFKKSFKLLKKEEIRLKSYVVIPDYINRRIEDDPHSALSLTLKYGSKTFSVINTHLAWEPTPKDKPFKTAQALKLYHYLQKIERPFIFSGDFNLTPDSKVVKMMNGVGRNLTTENGVKNTLNPHLHRIKNLSLVVDYVFVNFDTKVLNFEVVNDDISDHYGLSAKIEI